MTRIELTTVQDTAIRTHGERAYAQECCGFLLGSAGAEARSVVKVLPAMNDRGEEERHNRFTISPEAFLRAEKAAREEKLDVLGFYHSHPNAPARPSAYDLEHAWPWYSYVIVSVQDGQAKEMTSWVLDDDRSQFHEQSIAVVPDKNRF
jgi:proteasome lid subunit RPN8/RPN11